jgi:hypothetical protein
MAVYANVAERQGSVEMARAQVVVAQRRYDRLLTVAREADERESAARSHYYLCCADATASLQRARENGDRESAAGAGADRDRSTAASAPWGRAVEARKAAYAAAEAAREKCRQCALWYGRALADAM